MKNFHKSSNPYLTHHSLLHWHKVTNQSIKNLVFALDKAIDRSIIHIGEPTNEQFFVRAVETFIFLWDKLGNNFRGVTL